MSGLPRSIYYYYQRKSPADRWRVERQLVKEIFHRNRGRYGYRRITDELHRQGYVINHKTVRRLMQELGLVCKVRMKKYRSYKGEVGKIAPNLLERDFFSDRPLRKLVTDVTEFSLFGVKRYLSPVLDLFNGEILCYTLSDRPVLDMVLEMVRKLVRKAGNGCGAVLHSDQGWQYQNARYQTMLKDNGFVQSMSRKGNCLDNAVMENFFGLLKSELLYLQDFDNIEHFEQELHKYIRYYNSRRIKSRLGGKSPVEYRRSYEQSCARA